MAKFLALVVPKNGETIAVKSKGKAFELNGGKYNEPSNSQINTWRMGLFRVRYAVYTEGIPNPWDMASRRVEPKSYTAKDNLTVNGKYLSNAIRDALETDEKIEKFLWIVIIISGISLLVSAVTCWYVYKIAQLVHV